MLTNMPDTTRLKYCFVRVLLLLLLLLLFSCVEFRRNQEDFSLEFRTLSLGLTLTITQAMEVISTYS